MLKRQQPGNAEVPPAAPAKPRGSRRVALFILALAVVLAVPFVYWVINQSSNVSSLTSLPPPPSGSPETATQGGSSSVAVPPNPQERGAASTAGGLTVRRQEPAPTPAEQGAAAQKPVSRTEATDHIRSEFEKFFKPDEPPADPAPGSTWKSPNDGSTMAWIPPGTFLMGSPATEYGHTSFEEPQHGLNINQGFWMDTMEVTNRAYQAFVLANPQWQKGSPAIAPYVDGNYLRNWMGNQYPLGTEFQPVREVSWHAAQAYARWVGKRLPLEAEWEYACRAGAEGAYWWGQLFNPSFGINSPAGTLTAGNAMRRNAWGLFDMSGNIAEWTSSLFAGYPYRSNDGREDPRAAGTRTVRGGAWNDDPRKLRSAYREGYAPTMCSTFVGFRCVR
jgi:formylglycine-generating enzyme required for sulfatase activity